MSNYTHSNRNFNNSLGVTGSAFSKNLENHPLLGKLKPKPAARWMIPNEILATRINDVEPWFINTVTKILLKNNGSMGVVDFVCEIIEAIGEIRREQGIYGFVDSTALTCDFMNYANIGDENVKDNFQFYRLFTNVGSNFVLNMVAEIDGHAPLNIVAMTHQKKEPNRNIGLYTNFTRFTPDQFDSISRALCGNPHVSRGYAWSLLRTNPSKLSFGFNIDTLFKNDSACGGTMAFFTTLAGMCATDYTIPLISESRIKAIYPETFSSNELKDSTAVTHVMLTYLACCENDVLKNFRPVIQYPVPNSDSQFVHDFNQRHAFMFSKRLGGLMLYQTALPMAEAEKLWLAVAEKQEACKAAPAPKAAPSGADVPVQHAEPVASAMPKEHTSAPARTELPIQEVVSTDDVDINEEIEDVSNSYIREHLDVVRPYFDQVGFGEDAVNNFAFVFERVCGSNVIDAVGVKGFKDFIKYGNPTSVGMTHVTGACFAQQLAIVAHLAIM